MAEEGGCPSIPFQGCTPPNPPQSRFWGPPLSGQTSLTSAGVHILGHGCKPCPPPLYDVSRPQLKKNEHMVKINQCAVDFN